VLPMRIYLITYASVAIQNSLISIQD